ncbi:GumC family protein [Litoribrevibacter albus]|uniref:non-specific protein-tyrosine kinase n=1 Tax=Litoribrevibacter albus TaxID=1473156 RepID=A0AA37S8V3_9GAMM|nr:polysaccharide biosynthesis tyrosine autokinase [Litoribrevibacter albus]GLQ30289.1 chain-length determining protein [Litoribrevibacter albus]
MSELKDTSDNIEARVIDLRAYYKLITRHFWKIFSFSLVITLFSALLVMSISPTYKATSIVLIENKESKVLSIQDVYGLNTSSKEYFLTQFEILKSRELAERVVERLSLDHHPLFDPRQQDKSFDWKAYLPVEIEAQDLKEPDDAEVFQVVVEAFRKSLTVEPVRKTQLVHISFESSDSDMAALVANTMADVFIESHLEARLLANKKAVFWLTERLDGLKHKLLQSEDALQRYLVQEGLVDVSGIQDLRTEEVEQVTRRFIEARKAMSEAESIYLQVQSLGDTPSFEQLMAQPNILRHRLIHSLKEKHAETAIRLAELSKRYGPKHPKMIAAQSEEAVALSQLRKQVIAVTKGIEVDYMTAKKNSEELSRQLAEARKELQRVNQKEVKMREYQREVESNRHLYELFLNRAKETGETEGLQTAHARVIDTAVAPRLPIKPKKKLILIAALILSFLSGVVLVLVMDALDKGIRTSEDIEQKLKANFIGALPLIKGNKSKVAIDSFSSGNHPGFTEAMKTIRTSVMLSGIDDPHKVIVISSTQPNEGKSTVALNLAAAMGQMEKVLIIDADMRRPTVAASIGLERRSLGLSNLVAGSEEASACIHRIDSLDIDVLPSGVIPPNPLELISSKRFTQVINELSAQYDRIIIDSAPGSAVSDALVLASYADALIYVVKADSTDASHALSVLKRFREHNAPILGVVLNQVDMDKHSIYDDYYSYNYEKGMEEDRLMDADSKDVA